MKRGLIFRTFFRRFWKPLFLPFQNGVFLHFPTFFLTKSIEFDFFIEKKGIFIKAMGIVISYIGKIMLKTLFFASFFEKYCEKD